MYGAKYALCCVSMCLMRTLLCKYAFCALVPSCMGAYSCAHVCVARVRRVCAKYDVRASSKSSREFEEFARV